MINVKIKHLLIALGMVATLAGCEEGDLVLEDISVEEVEETVDAEEVIPSSAPIEEVEMPLTDDDIVYIEILNKCKDMNAETLDNVALLLGQYQSDTTISNNQEYVGDFQANILKLSLVHALLKDMEETSSVPVKFIQSHAKFITIFELQIESYSSTLNGIIKADSDLIDYGADKMNQTNVLLEEFDSEVRSIIN